MNAIISVDGSYIWQCSKCNRGFIFKEDAESCCQPAPSEKPKALVLPEVSSVESENAKLKAEIETMRERDRDFKALEADWVERGKQIAALKGEITNLQAHIERFTKAEAAADARMDKLLSAMQSAAPDAWDRLFEAALTGLVQHHALESAITAASNYATAALAERDRVREQRKEGK